MHFVLVKWPRSRGKSVTFRWQTELRKFFDTWNLQFGGLYECQQASYKPIFVMVPGEVSSKEI